MEKSEMASRRRSSVPIQNEDLKIQKDKLSKIVGGHHSALDSYRADTNRSVTPRKDFDTASKFSQTLDTVRQTKGKVLLKQ